MPFHLPTKLGAIYKLRNTVFTQIQPTAPSAKKTILITICIKSLSQLHYIIYEQPHKLQKE